MENNEIYMFHKGMNYKSYKLLGAHACESNGIKGIQFTTWAPNAQEMWIVGDFNNFYVDNNYKMKLISKGGLWSRFLPKLGEGIKYKYAIKTMDNKIIFKSDPYAICSEVRPNTASITYSPKEYIWLDNNWIQEKSKKDIYNTAINIYEIHLGSWRRDNNKFLTYEELSEVLPDYLTEMGYNYVEIMPLCEHPLDASWGYQCTGYYSLTTRYGNIEGFKKLVDKLHQNNIGVILDWVPGHFCKDAHGLYMFDGSPTYEYEEYWKADNKGWGTFNFDLGRPEVKSFLISNAMYWINEFHIDGLRVDAVSNIIYLSYGREYGEWVPNKYGTDCNLEGIQFLKDLNIAIKENNEKTIMIAEESTAWPKVSRKVIDGGLGFDFKWNMGWMNDVLEYTSKDPIYRKYHHNKLTFSLMYNYSERFILPFSHDEVVHGKKSLVDKMPGDYWSKFAGYRLLISYMLGHPGKKLNFMGSEFAQFIEWREYEQLEWKLIDMFPMHKKTQRFIKDINKFYLNNKALWELDYDVDGFKWIDADNKDQSIVSFIRRGKSKEDTLIFICNFTSVVRYDFRIGVPLQSDYIEVFNSDDEKYGGSGQVMSEVNLVPEEIEFHNQPYSIQIKVPPMATLILGIEKGGENNYESITCSIRG
ncbi:1,4-alpha-glucan branching protein GlgB [Clostridium paraputrificum]|uniref:1,4-alpha-glucan branching protein GlgB n=1 Tax=Clostridium paraputrificum TaxID=29363 RepID=UPI00374E65F3